MTDLEMLKRAREHISKAEMWFQHQHSEEDEGDEADGAISGLPCCASGALYWAIGEVDDSRLGVLEESLTKKWNFIYEFNDDPTTTHADVLALYDRAIAEAGK